ncbi:MAG TPA: lipase family protein [Bradyrhizobium sp.]|uniref:lipase family protein n=1 Tax=Bradyrhizobium sp. TaxID=376 RepID=UPI002C87C6BF|nr:lipase family protein [Bradyrhizobium sp.]HLZ02489.1 lipase family protein [Bradyrhizobium sp.]
MSTTARNASFLHRRRILVTLGTFLTTILLSTLPARAGQNGMPDALQGDGRVSRFYRWEGTIPRPGKLLRQEKVEPTLGLANAGTQLRILYSSIDGIDGKSPIVVSGLLFLPHGKPPAGGWPLMAWAHETAGMADICAPSWAGYSTSIEGFLNTWLAHGIAIVATDYQGLGTLGPHPYLAVRPGAYGVLDSVRAVQQSFPVIGKKVLLAGYSQGAQAAFGAAALQSSYAPKLDLRGVIATGTPYMTPETAPAMRADTAAQVSYLLVYPLYLGLMAQQSDPTLKASDMFSEKAMPLFEMTRRACVWQLVLEALSSHLTRAESVKPGFERALLANIHLLEYPSLKLSAPLFMGIGELDQDAPASLQLALTKKACNAGTTIEAHLYAGAPHNEAVTRLLPQAIRFADAVLAGKTVTPVCSPEAE